MPFRTRLWSAGKILLLVAALGATYVVFAVASMRVALKTREVTVPDLTNRTASEAGEAAARLGLALKVDAVRRPDPRVGADRVLAQDPPPGTVARRQRTVKVWLSAGQRAPSVPPLVGESARTAELRLAQDGLALATVSEIHTSRYPADVVVAQQPPARAPGSSVAILVNRGGTGPRYLMPDLIGVNGERAAEILRGFGFRVAVVDGAPYPGVPAGIVLRQNPQGGFQIHPGEPISLEVSR
jgi:beta-lactam-binding protein with PASTA domain